MNKNIEYIVVVRCLTPFADLDADDQQYWGEAAYEVDGFLFKIHAKDKDAALDEFHASIPIACLDDFEVTAYEPTKFKEVFPIEFYRGSI